MITWFRTHCSCSGSGGATIAITSSKRTVRSYVQALRHQERHRRLRLSSATASPLGFNTCPTSMGLFWIKKEEVSKTSQQIYHGGQSSHGDGGEAARPAEGRKLPQDLVPSFTSRIDQSPLLARSPPPHDASRQGQYGGVGGDSNKNEYRSHPRGKHRGQRS